MINIDSEKLLDECSAGIKMGVASISEVLPAVRNKTLRTLLSDCMDKHDELGCAAQKILDENGDTGKEPNPMAKSMSWVKTNLKLSFGKSDATVADLITDGCNMGVKSLNRYLNEFGSAEPRIKDIAKKVIDLEEKLAVDVRGFL